MAGGTGVVGAMVVARLRRDGHEVLPLARSTGADLVSGEGLTALLDGVEATIDVLSIATTSARAAQRFFTTTSRNLLDAGAEAGVGHHLALSIVGIDQAPWGYYQGKLAQEREIAAGRVPFTLLRAPQFHEFAGQMIQRASIGPITLVPRMRIAPMAAAEVADILADLAAAGPRGRTGDARGPREEQLPDLVRQLARHRGARRLVAAAPLPGAAGKAVQNGALVADEPEWVGAQTFADWLAGQPRGC